MLAEKGPAWLLNSAIVDTGCTETVWHTQVDCATPTTSITRKSVAMNRLVGGLLVWVVPFMVSCGLIGPDGKKVVSEDAFRTSMLLVGSITSSYCTYLCDPKSRRTGFEMAATWLLINWTLDLIVLVPLLVTEHNSLSVDAYVAMVPVWFCRIGLAYVGFVSMCVVAGACAERAANPTKMR